MKCLIDGCDFDNKNLLLFARHLKRVHKLTSEKYTIDYIFRGMRPKCSVCENSTRYFSFNFKKYCKEHSKIAESQGGVVGGKIKKTWNKYQTKDTDSRILAYVTKRKLNCDEHLFQQKQEIGDFLNLLGIEKIKKGINKTATLFEQDIYLPEQKLVIEFGNLQQSANKQNERKIHILKTNDCEKREIGFIHIFSDEWSQKQDLVKSMIEYRLGLVSNSISASKCKLILQKADSFFADNHISGNTRSIVTFTMVYNNSICAALALRKPFHQKKYIDTIEISRFAVLKHFKVPGAFSRLLKVAKIWSRENNYAKILSYADLRFGVGNVYAKNGFTLIGHTEPDFWWTNGRQRFNRFKFRAGGGKSEKQIAEENGVYRVYGCGSNIYVLDL